MDGHPFRPVAPGSTYRYTFPVLDRGGTYWYHPHPHGGTARQTYAGLAGFFVVDDEDEQRLVEALDLELGKTDIPLLIQDKVLGESGNFIYEPDAMAVDTGYEGDVVLVNLTPTPYLEVWVPGFTASGRSMAPTPAPTVWPSRRRAKKSCCPTRSSARTAVSWTGRERSVRSSSHPPSGWTCSWI